MAFDFPGAPNVGDTFVDPVSGATYRWNGYAWIGGGAAASNPVASPTPPPNPADNSLWWESDTGMLFLRYNDGNSSQWVQINSLPYGAGYISKFGVTDGSDAPAGQIGEVISSTIGGSGVPVTANTALTITSIALTAGDWNVFGDALLQPASSAVTGIYAGMGPTTAITPAPGPGVSRATMLTSPGMAFNPASHGLALKTCRASLSAPATYYLVGQINGIGGNAFGSIWARRVR